MSPLRQAVAASLTITLGATVSAGNWPQFRGPQGQGVSDETALPSTWGPATNVAWKTAVAGPRPFVAHRLGQHGLSDDRDRRRAAAGRQGAGPHAPGGPGQAGRSRSCIPTRSAPTSKHTYKVIALALDTGEVLVGAGRLRRRRSTTAATSAASYASPTPVTDGKRVYAYFGSEGLFAYDFSGKLALEGRHRRHQDARDGHRELAGPLQEPRDPAVRRGQRRRRRSSPRSTARPGRTVWKTQAADVGDLDDAGARAGRQRRRAGRRRQRVHHRLRPGHRARSCGGRKGLESNTIATPLVGHGLVIVSAGYPTKKVIAIRPGGTGDVSATDTSPGPTRRARPTSPSPILYGDYVYLITDAGLLTCLDAKTGAVKYEGGRPPVPAKFIASPVAFGGNLYLTSTDGDTFVVKAGSDARSGADQRARRAGLRLARPDPGPPPDPRPGSRLLHQAAGLDEAAKGRQAVSKPSSRMRRHLAFLPLAALLWAWPASESSACSCAVSPSPCASTAGADAVFVGRVISASSPVQFDVEQAFKGVSVGPVSIGNGPGTCALTFIAGERYIIYAYRDTASERLTTNMCTRTRRLRDPIAGSDLAFLELRASGRLPGGLLTGAVLDATPILDARQPGPRGLAGVRIRVTPSDGSPPLTTSSRWDGSYRLTGVPPGKFTVTADLPATFEPATAVPGEMTTTSCAEVHVEAFVDGRLEGRLR